MREAPVRTRVSEMPGVDYPIIQGGMQWSGRAELASAVSEGGGFGILTALTQPDPDALAREIARCREMTDRPFGVNLTLLPTINPVPYDAYIDAVIDGGVRVLEMAGRSPEAFIPKLKAAGGDAVSIDGFECGGHPGEDDIGLFVLLSATAAEVRIPIIASGGIGTGAQMAAAFPRRRGREHRRSGAGDRGARGPTDFADIRPFVAGARGRERVIEGGEIDGGIWTAGQVVGLIDDIPTCADLLQRMVSEMRAAIAGRLAPHEAGTAAMNAAV